MIFLNRKATNKIRKGASAEGSFFKRYNLMTQQELADGIGMRRETILHLENNRYNPLLEMALKISQVFNLKIEDLFELRQKEEA